MIIIPTRHHHISSSSPLTIITYDHQPTHFHPVLRSGASQGKDIYTVLREYTLLTGTSLSEH